MMREEQVEAAKARFKKEPKPPEYNLYKERI